MPSHPVMFDFSNVGLLTPARHFAGFPDTPQGVLREIAPRELTLIEITAGDLLRIAGPVAANSLSLIAFNEHGEDALASLGLRADSALDPTLADCESLLGWLAAKGARTDTAIMAAQLPASADQIILKSDTRLSIWVVHCMRRDALTHGPLSGGTISITHQTRNRSAPVLPPELGSVRDEFTIRRGTARAYELARGEYVQIIDIEGQQCSDFMAFRSRGLDQGQEWFIDSTATRSMVRRAYPTPGLHDKFFDQEMQPLLKVVQDTCGRHDTFGLACTARGYEERGFPGHLNCSDNMSHALSPYGVAPRRAWPAINFFWSTWVDPHSQHLLTEESHSRPGDYVAMQAIEDLVCVSTACPDDLDPINGWNPTDVHVRIYRPDAPIRRAVAYRKKEDTPMSISQESAFHERLAPLTGQFAPARDLWTPVSFPAHGTTGEYWACREKVTVQDMSGLRKFDIIGPDAERLLQLATTRDVSRLAVWRGSYTLMCDDTGTVIDDGTLFRLAPELFRWCCGSEESGRQLGRLAQEHGFQVRIHAMQNALPNLSLQGPNSRDLLRELVFTQPHVPTLDQLKWFGVTVARLRDRNGAPFMLSRSGYTGELGYEIFCAKADAIEIWDALMQAGQAFDITPMGTAALEILRIEAGLAAAGAEFAPGVDAFESGLGFAVDLSRSTFLGKSALERNAREPRRCLKGLLFDCDDVPAHGAPVFDDERQVGVVTSATRSPMLERTIAMARLSIEHAGNDTRLEVGQLDGRMKRLGATVTDVPFIDPQRKRARA